MRNYWTCSNFADWVRGTPKIPSGTSEEWTKWHKDAKLAHPVRFWLAEEALSELDDAWNYVPTKINNVRYYLNNRYTTKTHALTSNLPKGQWHEFETRLLHCTFDSFVDFIEIETAWSHVMWGDKEERAKYKMPWWRGQWWTRWFKEWRSPEAAIAHLEWEMTLKNIEWYKETDPEYGKPTHQAIAAKEKWALYYWWKHVRPQRVDEHEYCGWSAYCEERRLGDPDGWLFGAGSESKKDKKRSSAILEAVRKLEEQHANEDEEMLIRLIKLRKSLWT